MNVKILFAFPAIALLAIAGTASAGVVNVCPEKDVNCNVPYCWKNEFLVDGCRSAEGNLAPLMFYKACYKTCVDETFEQNPRWTHKWLSDNTNADLKLVKAVEEYYESKVKKENKKKEEEKKKDGPKQS